MYKRLSTLVFAVIAVLAVSLAPKRTSQYQAVPQQRDTLPIRITATIPGLPESMPLYKLATNIAPVEFFNEKLARRKLPTLKLDKQYYVVRSGEAKEEGLHAFIDMRSADAEFIPNLAELAKAAENNHRIEPERARSLATSAFQDERFMPKDVTEIRPVEPITVFGGPGERPAANGVRGKTTEPKQIMTIVPVVRYANGWPVYGLGSHAVMTFDNEGEMVGASRRWRKASMGERIKPVVRTENVRSEILRQLEPIVRVKGTRAIVDKIELAYYDGNKDYLQPVYHFEATVESVNGRISPIRVSGFIPIGKALEAIPDLATKTEGQQGPAKAVTPDPKLPRNGVGSGPTPDDVTLGEYCNRNWPNDNGYISMSYAFLNGLNFFNSILPGWTPPVTRTQWYEAWPWEVVGPNSRSYMNAVNIAYTVPHGDWQINTTLSNNADVWFVPNIGSGGNPGFGAAAGGVLATWVIMSCEVIPSYYDRANEAGGSGNGQDAFNPWWGVFQGLHNVLGFRTIMFYPDDATNTAFGISASLGGDVNAAWFQNIAAYHAGDGTYPSQHLQGAPNVHYDRASSMIDGRDLGQSIFNVSAQSPSTQLWSFWMGN